MVHDPVQAKGRRSARVAWLLAAALLAALFIGCTAQRRHAVLSFFFDGVPPLEPAGGELIETSGQGDGTVTTAVPALRPLIRHKPVDDERCEDCHPNDRGLALVTNFDRRGGCYQCHEHEALKQEIDALRYVHGPVALQNCLACHDAHESEYEGLLVLPDPGLCYSCHFRARVLASPPHQNLDDDKCLPCHAPHGGDSRYFLREGLEG